MTTYHGGKHFIGSKIAEKIYTIVSEEEEETGYKFKGYCEPFCGMLGVYRHIPELFSNHKPKLKYKASDMNGSVIAMWKRTRLGWKPPSKYYTKQMFESLKHDGKISAIKGFVGHVYTYRSVFMDSYHAHNPSKVETNRQRVISTGKQIKNVQFTTGDYTQFSTLKGYIIYCDPPYKNTNCRYYDGRGYFDQLTFDSDKFWKWCNQMSKDNIVFVSEFTAPKGTECVWKKGKERLYVL